MNAPAFSTPRLHIAEQPIAPEVIAGLFRDLDAYEAEARAIRRQLDELRQKHMWRERCCGMDMSTFRREIERRAGA